MDFNDKFLGFLFFIIIFVFGFVIYSAYQHDLKRKEACKTLLMEPTLTPEAKSAVIILCGR